MIVPSLAPIRRKNRRILFVAMEMSWLAVLFGLAEGMLARSEGASLVWAVWFYPAGHLFARIEASWEFRRVFTWIARGLVGAAALSAAVLFIIQPVSPAFLKAMLADESAAALFATVTIAALFTLARGWLLAQRGIDVKGFGAGFQVGIIVLFAATSLQHSLGLVAPITLPGILAFFCFGLFGLWAARRFESDAPASGRAGWSIMTSVAVAVVLGSGLALWLIVDHDFIRALLTPLAWLWEVVIRFLKWLFDSKAGIDLPTLPSTRPAAAAAFARSDRMILFNDLVRRIGEVAFIASSGVIIAALLIRNLIDLLRRLGHYSTADHGIVFERSEGGFLDDLRDLFAAIRRFLARMFKKISPTERRPERDPDPRVRTVREVYARFLAWTAEGGRPRPDNATPGEFLETLRGVLPSLEGELVLITETYVAARYGAVAPDPEKLRAVRAGWNRVRTAELKNIAKENL